MMHSGNWLDAADAWPLLAWPIFYSSITYGLLVYNNDLEKRGLFSYETNIANFSILATIALLSITSKLLFIYCIYIIGIKSLIAIPFTLIISVIFAIMARFIPWHNIVYISMAILTLLSFLTLRNILIIDHFIKFNNEVISILSFSLELGGTPRFTSPLRT